MRVLVCRARQESERTALALSAAGHTPVIAPVLDVVFRPVEIPVDGFDAVLLTSANALPGVSPQHVESLKNRPAYAVGRQTAAAARQSGFRDVRIGDGDAAALINLFVLTLPPTSRVLYLAGRDRKPDAEAGLAAHGYRVTVAETYAAEPAPPWEKTILADLAADSLDACLHFSRRSAALALAFAMQGEVASNFARLRHVCMSDDAASPLRAAALASISIAAVPTEGALVASLNDPERSLT